MRKLDWRLLLGDKKKGTVIYIILLTGVLLLLFGSWGQKDGKKEEEAPIAESEVYTEEQMEERLALVLSQIDGVGEVSVLITYRDDGADLLAQNTRTGSTSSEQETVMTSGGGENRPYVIGRERPKVQGVLVVADGGAVASIQEKIKEATCAVLPVYSHNVVVSGRRIK